MSEEELPEPERIEGAPHPRDTQDVFGQQSAEQAFLEAFNAGRLHHGWLLTGPRGVGKATLAWRIARFLLATPDAGADGPGLFGDEPVKPETLHIDPEHPVARRIAARSEPGLKLVRRGGMGSTENDRHKNFLDGKFSKEIRVSEIRELISFLSLSSAEGGRRVVIVDCADEMNVAAANALLKMLEEPPERTILLLVSHQPSRLLPTIRSRCRELRLGALAPDDLNRALLQAEIEADPSRAEALAALSGGSVGEAVRFINLEGLAIYAELVKLFSELPQLDRARAMALADAAAARGAEAKLDLLVGLIELFLARLAKSGAIGQPLSPEAAPGEAQLFARLAPSGFQAQRWAELEQELGERMRHGRAVNLDPAALILDTILKIRERAAG